MKKLASVFGALLFVIVLGILGFIVWQTPSYKGELQLSGLEKEVEVYFDDYGVPHIYAQTVS